MFDAFIFFRGMKYFEGHFEDGITQKFPSRVKFIRCLSTDMS